MDGLPADQFHEDIVERRLILFDRLDLDLVLLEPAQQLWDRQGRLIDDHAQVLIAEDARSALTKGSARRRSS